jgi:hypothetical protein
MLAVGEADCISSALAGSSARCICLCERLWRLCKRAVVAVDEGDEAWTAFRPASRALWLPWPPRLASRRMDRSRAVALLPTWRTALSAGLSRSSAFCP